MLDILEIEDFKDYELTIDSRLSDFKDFWDSIYFIIKCEEVYQIQFFDLEVIFMEEKDFSFRNIEDLIKFLKTGETSEFIHNIIVDNISKLKQIREVYLEYVVSKRDEKISSIIN